MYERQRPIETHLLQMLHQIHDPIFIIHLTQPPCPTLLITSELRNLLFKIVSPTVKQDECQKFEHVNPMACAV